MKTVFKLKSIQESSDDYSDWRTKEYYLSTEYNSYEEAEKEIPNVLNTLSNYYSKHPRNIRPDTFYLSIHKFVKHQVNIKSNTNP